MKPWDTFIKDSTVKHGSSEAGNASPSRVVPSGLSKESLETIKEKTGKNFVSIDEAQRALGMDVQAS